MHHNKLQQSFAWPWGSSCGRGSSPAQSTLPSRRTGRHPGWHRALRPPRRPKDGGSTPGAVVTDTLNREGLIIDFSVTPDLDAQDRTELYESEHAEVSFRIADAVNGEPVRGLYPAVWMDIAKAWKGKGSEGPGLQGAGRHVPAGGGGHPAR